MGLEISEFSKDLMASVGCDKSEKIFKLKNKWRYKINCLGY